MAPAKAPKSRQEKPEPMDAPKGKVATGSLQNRTMNGLEAKFAQELGKWMATGNIEWWRYEGIKLELGPGAWFMCDFFAMESGGALVAYETKGHMREAARVRLLSAARQYPFRFVLVKERKAGGFEYTEI